MGSDGNDDRDAAVTQQLTLYNNVLNALEKCVEVDEVKEIHDKAIGLQAYAMQAKDPRLIQLATEVKMRAVRKIGQLMKKELKAGQRQPRGGDRKSKASKKPLMPTLKQLGIDKNLGHHARVAAGLSEQDFEDSVEVAKKRAADAAARIPKESTPVTVDANSLTKRLNSFEQWFSDRLRTWHTTNPDVNDPRIRKLIRDLRTTAITFTELAKELEEEDAVDQHEDKTDSEFVDQGVDKNADL
jgi:hypothetical protein